MNTREQILQQVRSQLGRAPGAPLPPPPVPVLLGAVDTAAAARLATLQQRLRAVGGRSELAASPPATAAAVLANLRAANAQAVVLSDAPAVQALRAGLLAAGFRCLGHDAPRADLLGAGAGVTSAQWGIAETGTLVLDAAAERSRHASLLPPLHIALLPQSRVLATLGELLKTLPRPLPYAVTLITGPSRTADIELQLVVGVHGPRDLLVLLT